MYEGLDTVVLYEELAYEDVLPLSWKKMPEPFDPALIGSYADRNLRVLQALAALDEHGQPEKTDESSPHAADIMRLDLKVNSDGRPLLQLPALVEEHGRHVVAKVARHHLVRDVYPAKLLERRFVGRVHAEFLGLRVGRHAAREVQAVVQVVGLAFGVGPPDAEAGQVLCQFLVQVEGQHRRAVAAVDLGR